MSVEDADVIDFLVHDPNDGVVLVLVEGREWDGSRERLLQLQDKINSYVAYVRDGQMLEQHPELAGKPIRFELRCVSRPDAKTEGFLQIVRGRLRTEDLDLQVRQIGTRPLG